MWNSAYLCSVFKRGDATVKDNYRGIAVGSTMGKLFSMVVENRLSAFCEQNVFRASGQAGFRPDRRTSDHVFVLKHLIDKSRLEKKHMFACFVDFRKAYDLVCGDLLMKCLSEIGVKDNMLRAIVSMYWGAPMIMQQRQPLVAAFMHYCFLARVDPERADEIVPVDLSVSEIGLDSSELVEVSN
jgi:hypothetical protein